MAVYGVPSSAAGGVPAERAAAAVNDLVEAREGAARVRSFLQQLDHGAPWVDVVDGVLSRLSSAMSALELDDGSAAAAGGQMSPAAGTSDGARQSASSSRNCIRKRSFSRRSQSRFVVQQRVTATLDDGYVWRKYGQKEIQDSPHPRSYYRCTHKSAQGCNAKRYVQQCATDPSKHVVIYYGEHTCRDPSTIPAIDHHAAGASPAHRTGNLISFAAFAPSSSGANAAAASSQPGMMDSTAPQLSTSWCTSSDDVFSSSAGSFMQMDELGAVVGGSVGVASTTVGPAQDYGGGLGGAGSFLSSPSPTSIGFEAGSVRSMEDDDFFGLSP